MTPGGSHSNFSQNQNPILNSNDHSNTTMNMNTLLGDNNPFVNAQVTGGAINGRRLSVSGVPLVIPNVANASNNAATVMVQPYVINENDKMKFITLKSVKRLLEQYATFKASSLDNTKTLIFFISTECQTKLIAKQLLLGTELSRYITPQNVYLAKDKHVEDMLSDYLRPTSRDEFVTMFNQAMTHPRWKPNLEFNTVNYYREIFPHVVLFLEEAGTYDEYLRRGAMDFEKDYMPKAEWGKSEPGGMFRIALAILHPFQDNFVQLLNREKLTKIASMREFILYFTKVNSETSQMSLNILRQNNAMKKPEDFKVIAAQARKKSDEFKEYKDRASKAPRTGTPRPKYTRYVKNRLNELVPVEFELPEEGEEENSILNSDDEEDNVMTEEEFYQKYDEKREYQDKVAKEIRDWDESEVQLALHALCAIQPTSYTPRRGQDGIKIYKAKPVNTKDQVCFQYAFGNCIAGKECVYSHDSEKIKKFLKSSYERLLGAPAWDPKIVAEAGTAKTPNRGANHQRDYDKSNRSGSDGRGASQSPAANQTRPSFGKSYGNNYIIEVEKSDGKTDDLPSAGANQPPSAENKLGSSPRLASIGASRDDPDC
jgi:hypothetical protein